MYQRRKVGIEGYEDYECDTDGKVYGKRFGRELKYNINQGGYKYVIFSVNGKTKTFPIHRIIALTFIPNPDNLPQVNHIDGNRLNCSVDNLEWVTAQQNIIHSFKSNKRRPSGERPVIGRDKNTLEIKYRFNSMIEAGRFFGNNREKTAIHIQNIIWRIASKHYRQCKTYRDCIWEYCN